MQKNRTRKYIGLLAAIVPIALTSGCGPHQEREKAADDHGHEHGDAARTAQITAFGERHEVFAEHPLPVAGAPARFLTHVTDLKTLQPRREGPVRFHLRLGQEAPIEITEAAPLRAGIYQAMLTFPKAGDWKVSLIVPTESGDKATDFPPVKVYANPAEAEHAQVPEPPQGTTFLKEQQWQIGAGTEPASKTNLVEQLRLPATVSARPGKLAEITPPLAGHLLLPNAQSMPLVGDKVQSGQVLVLIQPSFSEMTARFVESEAEVVRARLALEQAEMALRRVEKLAQVEAKSARELQEAEFAFKAAQARHDAAVALQKTYRTATSNSAERAGASNQPAIELRSPITGTIVSQFSGAVGQYVTAQVPVFTVLDDSTVFIEAHVPETSIGRLGANRAAGYQRPDQPAEFVPITAAGKGRLVSLGIRVNPATRTIPLVYEVENPNSRLRVGQSVNLYVETARAEETLAIPTEAIVEEAGRPVAFVQVAGETFQKRDLILGIQDANRVQVLAGLSEGERVVTKGAYAVRLASLATAIPSHGHAH